MIDEEPDCDPDGHSGHPAARIRSRAAGKLPGPSSWKPGRPGSYSGRRESNSAVRIRSRGVGRVNFPSGTVVFAPRRRSRAPGKEIRDSEGQSWTGVALREVPGGSSLPGVFYHPELGPGRHGRLGKATDAYPSGNFNLDKRIAPLGLSVQGPQCAKQPSLPRRRKFSRRIVLLNYVNLCTLQLDSPYASSYTLRGALKNMEVTMHKPWFLRNILTSFYCSCLSTAFRRLPRGPDLVRLAR
jgi:hypothetical protein